MKRRLSGLAAALLCTTAALAQHAHAPHEHGVAELRVAIEGEMLEIEFASPLDNLVGFEHAPGTDRQRSALANAERTLNNFERLFALPAAAGCTVSETALEPPFGGNGAQAPADPAGHAELSVTYTVRCTAPAALDRLEVRIFDAFPATRRIRAERVSPRGQSAATLTAQQRSLAL